MLTAYQCETVAVFNERSAEIFCLGCWEDGTSGPATPLIRYSLDEEETARSYDMFELDEDHVEGCMCALPVECEGCGADLTEGYTDPECEAKQAGEVDDESDPALD